MRKILLFYSRHFYAVRFARIGSYFELFLLAADKNRHEDRVRTRVILIRKFMFLYGRQWSHLVVVK